VLHVRQDPIGVLCLQRFTQRTIGHFEEPCDIHQCSSLHHVYPWEWSVGSIARNMIVASDREQVEPCRNQRNFLPQYNINRQACQIEQETETQRERECVCVYA
jgi:hypothetical protein